MAKSPGQKREDEVLLRLLKTAYKPHGEMKVRDKAKPEASSSQDRST